MPNPGFSAAIQSAWNTARELQSQLMLQERTRKQNSSTTTRKHLMSLLFLVKHNLRRKTHPKRLHLPGGRGKARLLPHQFRAEAGLPLAKACPQKSGQKIQTRRRPLKWPTFPSVALPPKPSAHLQHPQQTGSLSPGQLSRGFPTWRPLGNLVPLGPGTWHTLGGVRDPAAPGAAKLWCGREGACPWVQTGRPSSRSPLGSGGLRLCRAARPNPPPNSHEGLSPRPTRGSVRCARAKRPRRSSPSAHSGSPLTAAMFPAPDTARAAHPGHAGENARRRGDTGQRLPLHGGHNLRAEPAANSSRSGEASRPSP